MNVDVYRFEFDPAIPLDEVEMTLHLAIVVVEGLAGSARVRLEVRYRVDAAARSILIEGGTAVGLVVTRVFTSLLIREFDDRFHIQRLGGFAAAESVAMRAGGTATA